jgi:hypothetical protein
MKMAFYLILAFIVHSCNTAEDAIIVLPRGYTGYVLIVHDQKDGREKKYHDGKRVYEVPSGGILLTEFPNNPGWSNLPEFYYEKIAPENKIPFTTDPKSIPENDVVAYGGTAGAANRDDEGKDVVRYVLYYVGNDAQIDSAYRKAEKLDIIKSTEE